MQKLRPIPKYDYDYTIIKALLKLRGVQNIGFGETECELESRYIIPRHREITDEDENKYQLSSEEYARARPKEQDIIELNEIMVCTLLYNALFLKFLWLYNQKMVTNQISIHHTLIQLPCQKNQSF